ncbi:MAG: SRPBCC family protein [Trueperaceae bacterium]|nr:SRPBCC family protein [Trueperaceae bacterium]
MSRLEPISVSVAGRIARPQREVYEAVADPRQLSSYFTTGGAVGRLETGSVVTWDFHDFPGAFPVTVVEAVAPERIVIEWGAVHTADGGESNRVEFRFEPLDDDTRTLVTITESAWLPSQEGIAAALGNCHGWSGMLSAMKAWVEHGINLREGFYR